MRILGIDPGTARIGFGVVDQEAGQWQLVQAGCIETFPSQAVHDRLAELYDHLVEIIELHQPDQLAIEQLFFARNVTTAIQVGQARGVILLAAAKAKLPYYEYTPLQVKQTVTGYGRAEKPQVQAMIKLLLKLKATPKPDDLADALAIALTHGMTNQALVGRSHA